MPNDLTLPRISIVVPSLNQSRFIESTLRSIVDQHYPNLELIVVDGGSTDGSLAIIEKYSEQISWWVSEPDSGQTAAINKGFARSTGDIMAWVNSDDLVMPGVLLHVARYFLEHAEVQVVYGNRILINDEGMEIGRWILPWHSNQALRWSDFVPQETLYWTRNAWDKVGAHLDETFQFAMDWDLLLRLHGQNVCIQHLPVYMGLFRIHRLQKTSSQISSIGQEEIQRLRVREFGFQPTRWRVILNTMPFLLVARFYEVFLRMRQKRRIGI